MDYKTTIQISRNTRSRLNTLGKKGDSYDNIIVRLLNGNDDQIRWKQFADLSDIDKQNVTQKMNEVNPDFMFVPEGKGYYGLLDAYFNDSEVRIVLNQVMADLNLI